MNDEGDGALLYALESQFVDLNQKAFKNSILDGPNEVKKKIKILKNEKIFQEESKPPSLSSRHTKVITI